MASRPGVKRLSTIAMGASDELSGNEAVLDIFNSEIIGLIHAEPLRRYLKLELFKGWGIFAQNFEGQILKDVLLKDEADRIGCWLG